MGVEVESLSPVGRGKGGKGEEGQDQELHFLELPAGNPVISPSAAVSLSPAGGSLEILPLVQDQEKTQTSHNKLNNITRCVNFGNPLSVPTISVPQSSQALWLSLQLPPSFPVMLPKDLHTCGKA